VLVKLQLECYLSCNLFGKNHMSKVATEVLAMLQLECQFAIEVLLKSCN
jgi:hypothetical protein